LTARRGWLAGGALALCLAGLLGLGFWLRWRYATEISLYVDEFTTLWGAQRILELGAPILPSGVLYTRGLLNTYVTALFIGLGGQEHLVGRLPGILFGLAAIAAIFWSGRREWNARVGLLAAVGLTLLPEMIQWGGRARFYSQLLCFVLLTVWAGYTAIRPPRDGEAPAPPTWRANLLFAGLFVLALFSQEETLLLYPTLLLGFVWWRGWRVLLQPPVLASQALILAAMAARYLLETVGQPGYFETIQAERPYVGLVFEVTDAWRIYSPLLLAPERLPFTLGALVAVAVALALLARQRGRPARLPLFHQATLFFALNFLGVFAILLALVGGTWREARYLLIIEPLWLLVGAAGLVWLIDRLTQRAPLRWALTGAASFGVALVLWAPAQTLLAQQVEGYDRVLAWVAAQRAPGDVVLSPQPPACAIMLGEPCDYYMVGTGWEPYVIPNAAGVLVDRWTASPLLADAATLEKVIRQAPHTWLVVDGLRLGRRYDDATVRVLVEQFASAYEERGVTALLATGWQTPTVPPVQQEFSPPLAVGPLDLEAWTRTELLPGAALDVTLYWRKREFIDSQINTSLRLVASDGAVVAQADGPPARGLIPTYAAEAVQLPDPKTLALPADLAPARYRLDMVAYDVETTQPVAEPLTLGWRWVGAEPPMPVISANERWGNGLQLVGHDPLPVTLTPGAALDLRLAWSATTPLTASLTAFVHLLGPDGVIVAQADRAPEGGFYPTSAWPPGAAVADHYRLELPPALPPGRYRLVTGWYDPASGARVPVVTGEDAVELTTWEVE
jgi:4-amino-4-deoxy-L-arabinose transferase-like glycosyltransferase